VGGIADTTNRYVFLGATSNLVDGAVMSPISSSTPVTTLVPPYSTEVSVSGGVCAVGPFLFAYGNNGLIRNSDVNNPLKWANPDDPNWYYDPGLCNDVNVCNSKIVKGISYRGSGAVYAALFWSLDSIILATFCGAPKVFDYNVLYTNVSIIAPNSVVERSGEYYWLGDGRFFCIKGNSLVEIPNNQNRDWFFNNINQDYQHLAWGMLNPEYNEIWWHFPQGISTECNWVLIFNYEENCWYDTPLNRGCGVYSSVINAPIMVSNQVNITNGGYDIWLHEFGNDKIDWQNNAIAIPCSFTTGDIGSLSSEQYGGSKAPVGIQNWMKLMRVESDAKMSGEWQMTFTPRKYPLANPEPATTIKFYPGHKGEDGSGKVDIEIMGRIMQLTIGSNTLDTSMLLGDCLLTVLLGDPEGI
jgi:hypothetical protein